MRILFVILLAAASLISEAQVTLNGVKLPAKLSKENQELNLNGGAVRQKYWFKIYVIGLYVQNKGKDSKKHIEADEPMGIRLQVTSSMVTSDNMAEPIRDGFNRSLNGKVEPLKPKIEAFIKTFTSEEIKEGDVFDLWYIPGVGVKSYKNGKYVSTTTGLDFKQGLFGIWLGPNTIDEDVRKGMLGG